MPDVRRGMFTARKRLDALLLGLTVLIVMLMGSVVYWTLGRIEAQIKQQTADSLRTVVATTQEAIRVWVNTVKEPVAVIASRSEVVSPIQLQAKVPAQPELLRKTRALANLRDFLSPVLEVHHFRFSVVNPDGIQIAAQTDDQVGSKVPSAINDS